MANEPVAVTDFLAELRGQWDGDNVAEPRIIEVNNSGTNTQGFRIDLNQADHILGRPSAQSFTEQPIGNWKYGNRTYNLDLELYTKQSRLNLYNLVREVRKICHARMHDLTNFQRMQFISYGEQSQEQANIWVASVQIQLVNNGVLLETT